MGAYVVPPLTGRLDMALSNFIKGYRQAELVTDYIFPRLPVARQADVYWVFGRESQQLTEKTLRAPGSPAQQTNFTLSTAKYYCPSRALKSVVPDEDRLSYTVGDLNMDAAALNQSKILLDREIRAFGLVDNVANYPAANTLALSGTSQWDQAASTPILDVQNAKRAIRRAGVEANILILSEDVADVLSNHPTLIDRFKYTTLTGALDENQLATAFRVNKVVIARAVQFDGENSHFVWSNVALLAYNEPTIGDIGVLTGITPGAEGTVTPKSISFGKSFTWTGAPGTVNGYGVVVYRCADASAKSDEVAVDWYSSEALTAPDCGFLFTNCLANPSD